MRKKIVTTLCFIRNVYKELFSRQVKLFKKLRNGLDIFQKNKERNAVILNSLRNAWLVIELFEDHNATCIVKCSLFFWWLFMNLEKCKKFIKYVLILHGISLNFNHFDKLIDNLLSSQQDLKKSMRLAVKAYLGFKRFWKSFHIRFQGFFKYLMCKG